MATLDLDGAFLGEARLRAAKVAGLVGGDASFEAFLDWFAQTAITCGGAAPEREHTSLSVDVGRRTWRCTRVWFWPPGHSVPDERAVECLVTFEGSAPVSGWPVELPRSRVLSVEVTQVNE